MKLQKEVMALFRPSRWAEAECLPPARGLRVRMAGPLSDFGGGGGAQQMVDSHAHDCRMSKDIDSVQDRHFSALYTDKSFSKSEKLTQLLRTYSLLSTYRRSKNKCCVGTFDDSRKMITPNFSITLENKGVQYQYQCSDGGCYAWRVLTTQITKIQILWVGFSFTEA